MKKILASAIAALSISSTVQADVPSPTEPKKLSIEWHPTSVAVGAIVGGAFFGGVGAVVVGGLVGEVAVRLIKKQQATTTAEIENTNGKIDQ